MHNLITSSYGVNQYAVGTGEAHTLLRPRSNWSGKRAFIWLHGANRTAADGYTYSSGYADLAREIAQDFPVLYADMGGLFGWGNASVRARITDAFAFMVAQGCKADQVVLIGASMGGMGACNYARRNLSLVKGLVLFIPAINGEDIRANDRLGSKASFETAWTNNATWQAARPTDNPYEYSAELAGSLPIGMWYSNDDPVCLKAYAEAFGTSVGTDVQTNLGNVGHDVAGISTTAVREFCATLA